MALKPETLEMIKTQLKDKLSKRDNVFSSAFSEFKKKKEEMEVRMKTFEDYMSKISEEIENFMEKEVANVDKALETKSQELLDKIEKGDFVIKGYNIRRAPNGNLYYRIEGDVGIKKFDVTFQDGSKISLETSESVR